MTLFSTQSPMDSLAVKAFHSVVWNIMGLVSIVDWLEISFPGQIVILLIIFPFPFYAVKDLQLYLCAMQSQLLQPAKLLLEK